MWAYPDISLAGNQVELHVQKATWLQNAAQIWPQLASAYNLFVLLE